MAAVMAATGLLVGTVVAQPGPDRTITETSMGLAVVGSTQSELEVELGSDYTVMPGWSFVDTEGVEVALAGATRFSAFHVAGDGPALNVLVTEVLVTENPEYQLANGVGPGTTIEDAVAIYGTATVAFSTESAESFNESTDVETGSIIALVWMRCVGDECPTATLLETGAAEATLPLIVVSVAMIVGGVMVALTSRRPAAIGGDDEIDA